MISSTKGNALILIIIMGALLAVVATSSHSLLSIDTSVFRMQSTKNSYKLFIANLRRDLGDPHTCEVLLKGQPIGGGNKGDINSNLIIGSAVQSFFATATGSPAPVKKDWVDPTNRFKILKAFLETSASPNIPTPLYPFRILHLDKPSPILYAYKVRIYFDIISLDSSLRITFDTHNISGKNPEYVVDLIVNVDSGTGLIYSCHGVDSIAEACEMAGGVYDASADMNVNRPELRCHPNFDPKVNPYPAGRCWQDIGGVKRTSAPPLPNPAVPPTCAWPYKSASWIGRIGGEDLWVCEWCNNQQWTPGVD